MKLNKVVIETYKRAQRLAILQESTAPMLGPYYWTPTPNGWDLMIFPEELYGEAYHDAPGASVWRRYVVPTLSDLWGLSDQETLELRKYAYGVPRGRVSKAYNENIYYLNHGNDAPLPKKDAIRKIIKEMNLSALLRVKKLRIVYDNHERMIAQHMPKVESIIARAKARQQ